MARILNEGTGVSAKDGIAGNSVALVSGDLVSLAGGFVIKAVATGKIAGVAKNTKTFDSDNQTVAKAKAVFVPSEGQITVELTADATIAQADVDSYFNINTDGTVDVATKRTTLFIVDSSGASATAFPVYAQVKLVRVISSTVGEFEIVNY